METEFTLPCDMSEDMSYFGKDFDLGFKLLIGLSVIGALACILSGIALLGWIAGVLLGAWTL